MTTTSNVNPTNATSGSGQKDAIGESQANAAEYKKVLGDSNQSGSNDMAYYLKLQRAMLQEQQAYQAVSTIMNIRATSAQKAIDNARGRG